VTRVDQDCRGAAGHFQWHPGWRPRRRRHATQLGAGTFLGSLAGGRLADKSLMATLCLGLFALAAILAAFTATAHQKLPIVITLFLFGMGAFVINPPLQTRVMNLTLDAPTLASTGNISAFNFGNAIGPWLGGIGISAGGGLLAPSQIGAALALAALALAATSVAADRRMRSRHKAPWRRGDRPPQAA
jgi:MFS transporter, DHA1 family, inner membrane transport protein